MSQCITSSCGPQTGGGCPCQLRNALKGGKMRKRRTKGRVRFASYVKVCNSTSCKRRRYRKTHKKLPKNCKNVSKSKK